MDKSFEIFPLLESERLLFEEALPLHHLEIFHYFTHEEICEPMGFQPFTHPIQARKTIEKWQNSFKNKSGIRWRILQKDNHQFAGTIAFRNIYPENKRAEIGYSLLPKFRGKGLMFEAMEKIIEFGFNKLDLQHIEAYVFTNNIPSIRILEKHQFQREAQLDNFIFHNQKMHPVFLYRLLNDKNL